MKIFYQTIIGFIFLTCAGANAKLLPPEPDWQGKSDKLIKANSKWSTPIEANDFTRTPNAEKSYAWLSRLAKESENFSMSDLAVTLEGRPIKLFIASKSKHESEAINKNGKPTLLFHGGIHAGEIDGKDAGMMFMRDVMLDNYRLLDKVNVLFIPILNVDGHEKRGFNQRVNQRGPDNMGWRTNSQNLNLNRDYSKLETVGVRTLVKLLNQWRVDLYLDIHVTDGIDYQYDITYGYNLTNAYSKAISTWLEQQFRPQVDKQLAAEGHVPGPLIFAIDNKNPDRGIIEWHAGIRYSNGYGDARRLPTILVENHSLKNYKRRVLGTVVLLNSSANALVERYGSLRQAIEKDAKDWQGELALAVNYGKKPARRMSFLGIDFEQYHSPISNAQEVRWLGQPRKFDKPVFSTEIKHKISGGRKYWIPSSRPEVIKTLVAHGIEITRLNKPKKFSGLFYRLEAYQFNSQPFEGKMMVSVERVNELKREKVFPAGSVIVDTRQKLGALATLLLEPLSGDSLLQWGYFNTIFNRTEYIEGYVIAPLAQRLLENNPTLKKEFEAAVAKDDKLKEDANARLQWFYQRSEFYDPDYLVYPVGIEL